ncbi:MAG: hypothetical protein Q8K75_04310 [Chlamydiales bacterium]|nr:hypothetical protein [Chlamydiales bacterium]
MEVISALQGAMDIGKSLFAVLKTIKEVDDRAALLQLQQLSIDLQTKLLDVRDENNSLLEERQNLRRQLQLKDELHFDDDSKVYWRMNKGQKEGPFCSTCYGDEGKVIALYVNDVDSWHCYKCKSHPETSQSREKRRQEYKELNRGRWG